MYRKLIWTVVLSLATASGVRAQQTAQPLARPAITGISHMCVFARDMRASDAFYGHDLGATRAPDPQDPAGVRYYFSPRQFVTVLPLPAGQGASRQGCVAFVTADAPGLAAYLRGHSLETSEIKHATDGSVWFDTHDPEGNVVQFVQGGTAPAPASSTPPISTRIIHVGYMVHSREAEDAFYRMLLGFRPYWIGWAQPGTIDWISQQVPEGQDWIEYMMVGDGAGRKTPADAALLGVLNHVSLGVVNMEAAVTTLLAGDRLSVRHDGPKMGHDGKWQTNMYDPDGTRVELMEFKPSITPCCTPVTADAPTP